MHPWLRFPDDSNQGWGPVKVPCTCLLHFDARQLNARSKWETSFSCCMVFCTPVWRRLQCNVSVIPSRVPHHVFPLRILPALLVEATQR